MEEFNEDIFVAALATRPEDARRYLSTFNPRWLREATLIPVLQEIFDFTKKYGTPPDIKTLNTIFKDRDPLSFSLTFAPVLEKLRTIDFSLPEGLYTLDKARNVAIIRSFQELASDQAFLKLQSEFGGTETLNVMYRWINQFSDTSDEVTCTIKEAIEGLVNRPTQVGTMTKIACGLTPLDQWSEGGLRPQNIGLIMAPTGHGKSVMLMNIARHVALIEEEPVWFVTNELSMGEQAERFLSRLTGKPLSALMEDPSLGFTNLDYYWQTGLDTRLRLTSVNKEVSTDDLEAIMNRWTQLTGWKPKLLVLDFMERMKPNRTGYRRDQEWTWLQAIAEDLHRFATRHSLLIWTAAQTNRSGLSAKHLALDMSQGSIRYLQEASLVAGAQQKEITKGDGTEQIVIELTNLKMRHGKKTFKPIRLLADLSTMTITKEEIEMVTVDREDDEPPQFRNRGQKKKQGRRDRQPIQGV